MKNDAIASQDRLNWWLTVQGSELGYGLKSQIQGAMVHQKCAEYESKHS
jgi:hypothetical protein